MDQPFDFDLVIAHVVASTGLPWDQILDEWDLPRLDAMTRYWNDHPPVHVMVAAYLGVKPSNQSKQPSKSNPQESLQQLAGMGVPVTGERPDDPWLDLFGFK